MSDDSNVTAFSDITDDSVDDTTDGSRSDTNADSEAVTDSVASSFTDAQVRSNLPPTDENLTEARYEDPDGNGAADDTDPRGLFRKPTLDELRFYAREGPYGHAVVQKPLRDAFKNGFTVEGDNTEPTDGGRGRVATFLHTIAEQYRKAKIRSRRDGLAILMHVTEDGARTVSEPIDTDSGTFAGLQLWTLDNLADDVSEAEAARHTDYTAEQLYVSEGDVHGGVVVVDDIESPDHGDVVGYGIRPREQSDTRDLTVFVHADRCHHFVNGDHVDGPLGSILRGEHVGESVLTPVLQQLKAAKTGTWAIKQILLRYSAPLHAIEPPETWGPSEWETAEERLEDISMMSDAMLPPGSELTVAEGVSEFDPEPYFETLVKQICAGTVFTTSVLQGTQTGTVSGSETDVKGYFSNVQVLRQQEYAPEMKAIARKVANYDQQTIPRVADVDNVQINWGALFKPTDVERAEGAVSLITAATNGIKNYVLTPDEARELISEEWAEFDIDVDLNELAESQWDDLDRINIREAGQGPRDDEAVGGEGSVRQNPTIQNGGGQPAGQTRSSSQPTRADALADAIAELDDEQITELTDTISELTDDTDTDSTDGTDDTDE